MLVPAVTERFISSKYSLVESLEKRHFIFGKIAQLDFISFHIFNIVFIKENNTFINTILRVNSTWRMDFGLFSLKIM